MSRFWGADRLSQHPRVRDDALDPTTQTGLAVHASYDPNWYPKGVKITDTQMDALALQRHNWHGDWNYTLAAA